MKEVFQDRRLRDYKMDRRVSRKSCINGLAILYRTLTYLRPQVCVAVQLVGLDIDILLSSLTCSSDLCGEVSGCELYDCQAVCPASRVSDLNYSLHSSVFVHDNWPRCPSTCPSSKKESAEEAEAEHKA